MNISRRTILASAAVALIPVTAITQPAEASPIWKTFESGLRYHAAMIDSIDDDIWLAGKAIKLWEKRNPFPDDHWSTPDELEAVQLRERAWAARYENAMRCIGAGKYHKARNRAYTLYEDLLQRIADTPALTLLDQQAKARLTRFERADGPIRASLIRAILA